MKETAASGFAAARSPNCSRATTDCACFPRRDDDVHRRHADVPRGRAHHPSIEDSYDVRIEVPHEFPDRMALAWETGGRSRQRTTSSIMLRCASDPESGCGCKWPAPRPSCASSSAA